MKINVDFIYPVGSIYISINSTNPSKYFGGTWTAFATGRTLVGVDTNQTEFNTVQKTGGSKYLQNHTHTWTNTIYTGTGGSGYGDHAYEILANTTKEKTNTLWTHGVYNVTTGDSGNLQPYITVYMWQRTA